MLKILIPWIRIFSVFNTERYAYKKLHQLLGKEFLGMGNRAWGMNGYQCPMPQVGGARTLRT
jgi:hypothetical protein